MINTYSFKIEPRNVCFKTVKCLVNIYEVMSRSFSRVAVKTGFALFSPKLVIVGFLISASAVVWSCTLL